MTPNILGRLAQQLILPVDCLGCYQEGDWICSKCLKKLSPQAPPTCVICGLAARDGLCQKCQKSTYLDRVITFFGYQEPLIQELVKEVKYAGHFDALNFFIKKFGRNYRRVLKEDWVLSFIPQSGERTKQRGFNQAEELAKAVARDEFQVKKFLGKKFETAPQAKLDRKERLKNVANSFELIAKPEGTVVICDDVITTGSTLKEAARILKKGGAEKVVALTIAHG